jgi:hypothetical protein
MAKKIAQRQKNNQPEALAPEQRWMVVFADNQRPAYLPSRLGIDQDEAQRLASSLARPARAVPVADQGAPTSDE